jgi:hypothetical protein
MTTGTDLGVLQCFEVAEDSSFELICTDCGEFLYFAAEKPELPDGKGFFSNLSLADLVAAAERHTCNYGEVAS